ncbi:MAG: phosphopentomutase [Nitrospirota bacterium]|jgi:phosphopentomutase
MARAIIIVLDGVGVGAMPDASRFGDSGSHTLGNLSRAAGGLNLPALGRLGLGNIADIQGVSKTAVPWASWGRMAGVSAGKDTITGHWEMAGITSRRPFPTYPEGFPPEIIEEFERRTGRKALWNRPASGTEIIERLGDEHMRTGNPIVYTSADSVFQVAAHEDVIPVEELYRICEMAREILKPPHNVCRVIARPFVGPPYVRTYRRKDFALTPPGETVLDMLCQGGLEVWSVGKVCDMFGKRGFTRCIKSEGNADGMRKLSAALKELGEGLLFINLVDFDTLYGHRNDTAGFKAALEEFDAWLDPFVGGLGGEDNLFVTADHGCDPTTPSTDHSREYVPLLYYRKGLPARSLGTRETFADLGATVADIFGVGRLQVGKSFLRSV